VRAATGQSRGRTAALVANVVLGPGLILGAAFLARRNVKRGRGDRRGAARAAAAILVIVTLSWLFSAHHVADPSVETNQFFTMLAQALFQAGLFWLFYLAIEPQVRRVWPHILITWSRLLSGAFRDPLVGRDLLVGLSAGLLLTVITLLFSAVPQIAGLPQFAPALPDLNAADGAGRFVARVLVALAQSLQNGALGVLGLVLLRMVLKRTWLAFVFGSLMFGFMAAQGQFESDFPLLDYTFGVLLCVVLLVVALRFGMFATMVAFFAHFVTTGIAVTSDPGRVNFQNGVTALVMLAAIAAVGFYFARAGEPLFGNVLTEE
jgi:serine/threonine-protein kinase